MPIKQIIKQQFDLREEMSWKYGLRTCGKVKVDMVGLKMINLAKNKFGNFAASKFA